MLRQSNTHRNEYGPGVAEHVDNLFDRRCIHCGADLNGIPAYAIGNGHKCAPGCPDKLETLLASHDLRIRQTFERNGRVSYQMVWTPHEQYDSYFPTRWFDSEAELIETLIITLEDDKLANIFKMSGDLFKYLSAEMIPEGRSVTRTIRKVQTETMENDRGKQQRAVIFFEGSDLGFVVGNKVNTRTLVQLYGPETDNWIGKPIELYTEWISAFGKDLRAIRIRRALPAPAGANGSSVSAPASNGSQPEPPADPAMVELDALNEELFF